MSQAVLCFSFVGLLFVELILVCEEINRCTLRVCVVVVVEVGWASTMATAS